MAVAMLAAPLAAESPGTQQEGGDFTFKRVAVPKGGVSKRINVQIDPDADIYRITPGAEPRRPGDPRPESAMQLPPGLMPEGPSAFDWYWEAVSPAINVDPAVRFTMAMDTLQKNALKIGTPRLKTLQGIVHSHGVDILKSTIGTEVSPALVLAVISVESAGRTDAVSHAGAEGLMQLMPGTAARFGVTDSLDTKQNIQGGVAYLDWLLKEFKRDPVLALAGYNAGEGAVGKHNGVPPFAETRAYVPKVLAAWNVARGMCLTPPQLISDGCVFVSQSIASGG
ncbi:MAG: lytic transglycosylase domain-containing protein [Silicimonas sp.]|nr:lytic transglycosylase domain-containing protein [Silicimonas sp.]